MAAMEADPSEVQRTSDDEAEFEAELRTSLSTSAAALVASDTDGVDAKAGAQTTENAGTRENADMEENVESVSAVAEPSQPSSAMHAGASSAVIRARGGVPAPSSITSDPHSVLQTPVLFESSEFIQTSSGNKVAANSVLCGSHKIHMAGRSIIHPGVVLRGDLASLRLGRYVSVGKGTTLRPAFRLSKNAYIPISVGDYVTIGEDCVISAASIANHVVIGDQCVLGKRCILKECCRILPGSVIPPDTVIPPMTVYGGVPGRFIGELFESVTMTQKKAAVSLYKRFLPKATKL